MPAIFYFHPWEVDPGQPRVADCAAPLEAAPLQPGFGAMAGKLRGLIAPAPLGPGRRRRRARRARMLSPAPMQ